METGDHCSMAVMDNGVYTCRENLEAECCAEVVSCDSFLDTVQ